MRRLKGCRHQTHAMRELLSGGAQDCRGVRRVGRELKVSGVSVCGFRAALPWETPPPR